MGRPKVYEEPRIATAVRLPASLHRELHATASARDVSANLLVINAVADYLRRLTPPEGAARRGPRATTSKPPHRANGRGAR